MRKTEGIPSEMRNETRAPTLCSYSVVLKVITRTARQEKEVKGTQIIEEKAKGSLFLDNTILHLKYSKDLIRKPCDLILQQIIRIQN